MKTKVCKDCGEEKCESLFFKKHANCKVCHLLKKKKWRKENPEEYKKQTKKYYESTKGEQSKKKKVWIENNREKYNRASIRLWLFKLYQQIHFFKSSYHLSYE